MDNIILNMPFDENVGSAIAYDNSVSRADGTVIGASFVSGRNGNCIHFAGDGGRVEINQDVLSGLTSYTMLMFIKTDEVETGTPTRLIWLLNFGDTDPVQFEFPVTSGQWFNIEFVKDGTIYYFYQNTQLIHTVTDSRTLAGVSLNQDYYGTDYGLAQMSDVKIYNIALTQAEIIEALSEQKEIAYYIDGTDMKTYNVCVSASRGLLSRPKMKEPYTESWDNYHGQRVDLQHKYLDVREIELDCFIKANSKNEFIKLCTQFQQQFDQPGTQRLLVDVHPIKPLIYEVYCNDQINPEKTWNNDLMVGTFTLKLIEPNPVKRILKHLRTSQTTAMASFSITARKRFDVFWGDGTSEVIEPDGNLTVTHTYSSDGDYFIVIAGPIEEITSFTTNDIIIFNKI